MDTKTFKEKFDVLVQFFLVEDKNRKWLSQDFSREVFAAKKIIASYPDFDFFYFIPDFYNKFNSLLGLTSKKNKYLLDLKYKEWQNSKSKEIKLEEKPLINIQLT